MKCVFAFAVVLLAAVASCVDPTVTLSVTQPTDLFLKHVTVQVAWQLEGGDFDPVNDYVCSWWKPFASTYVEYFNVTGNNGSAPFDLLNARAPFFFRYYRGDKMLAQSEEVTPLGSYPMQIHTQFIQDHHDQAKIIWVSNRTSGTETVYYGPSPDNLNMSVTVTRHNTYTQPMLNDKVGLPPIKINDKPFANLSSRALRCKFGTCYNDFTASELFVDPGVFHYAELTNVTQGSTVYFQVGESDGFMSDVRHFNARLPLGADQEIQVLYVADAGAGRTDGRYTGSASHNAVPIGNGDQEGARHVWDAILRDPLHPKDQASIMNGDISYARGWPWVWELFHNQTQHIFGPAPVMASYGNHEFDYAKNPFYLCQGPDSGGEAGIPTAQRFDFKSETEPWYHMAQGPIHFFALSSEHSVSEQSYWLRQELPKVNRTKTPWLIVFFHRPFHMSSTWIDHELAAAMSQGYSDLFSRYGVDMVLTGHAHYYERMCAINTGECANYDFRPDWHEYENTQLKPNSCTKKYKSKYNTTYLSTCKIACMYDDGCNGAYMQGPDCYHIYCPQPFELTYNSSWSSPNDVYSLTRKAGRPPVYVVDGTAGGVHVPLSSPKSPLTEYKDFSKWGYSRINANGTSLTWSHWHIDGSLVDSVTLKPVNV